MSKIVSHIPRVLLGFVFFAFGMMGLLHLIPSQPAMEGPAGAYMTGLNGTYLITLVKATEVLVGALLLANRFVPLALVVLAPIMVNIVAFHALYAPSGLVLPVVLVGAQVFVAWQHRAAFSALLAPKATPIAT